MKKKILIFTVLLIIYTYVVAIGSIPSNLVIFEGEKISLKTLLGITLDVEENEETVQTSSNSKNKQKVAVKLFNNFEVKDLNVDVLPRTKVIPVGNIAGLKLYTSGVLVVGMTEIKGIDNKKYKPFQNSGIEEGDRIISIENENISTVNDLTKEVNNSKGKDIKIKYIHKEESKECSITPVQTGKEEYKLGLWVRDSTAGVRYGHFL